MKFSDIPGLAVVKENLVRSVRDGKVAHAQLFLGKEGALNLPLAIAYSAYLHCTNRNGSDACGTCPACSKNLKYIHPDTNFVFPLGNIRGDKDEDRFRAEILKTWRSFLLEQPFGNLDDWTSFYGGEDKLAIITREDSRQMIRTLTLKSFESPFKVMIVWLPEFMHPSAANGILKILEEPPPSTFFLLACNAPDKLLPTILSRLQVVMVPLLTDDEIVTHLKNTPGVEEKKVTHAARLAEGNLNYAMKLLDADEGDHQEIFIAWMRACFKKEYARLVDMADEFHGYDKMAQRNFLQYSLGMLRETLLHRSGATSISRAQGSELKFVQDFSKVATVERIDKSAQLMTNASLFLERNGSAKMIFMDLSIQLSQVIGP